MVAWPLALAAALSGAPAAAAGQARDRPAVPVLRWRGCDAGFLCARARVPLDYALPGGTQISLALIKLPARRPRRRIGTLFVDPGGPGSSGVDFLRFDGAALPRLVRNRFDIIGFDPRGVGHSTPLHCFRDYSAELDAFGGLPAFPITHTQALAAEAANARLVAGCASRQPRLASHMTTADVARDLDLLRRAVGDRRLSFVGYSYGSYISAVYANMFPHRVRAIVADGAINPQAWVGSRPGDGQIPVDVRLQSDTGSYAALRAFLQACDADAVHCPFSAGPSSSGWKLHRLMWRLRAGPITTLLDGTVDYAGAVASVDGQLYSDCCWSGLAAFLQRLWLHRQEPPGVAPAHPSAPSPAGPLTLPGRSPRGYPNGLDSGLAVTCSDSHNPTDPAIWEQLAHQRDRVAPYFGSLWTWLDEGCATWTLPSPDRYEGPFDRVTRHPLLVIGNLRDPATRYQDAVTLSQTLARARLLTIDGTGHTSLGAPSHCARGVLARYLVSLTLPPPGTVCTADAAPFS